MEELSAGELLSKFQSLGFNCELGIAQRYAGIEPPGLFRFMGTDLEPMAATIANKLDDLIDPERIAIYRNGAPEYERYGIALQNHGFAYETSTFVPIEPEAEQRLLRDQIAHLTYMKRMFLETAEEGLVHFVRINRPQQQDEAVMERLFDALASLGPNRLLWVCLAEGDVAPNTIIRLKPGFYKGYISELAPPENVPLVSVQVWVDLCTSYLRAVEAET